MAPFVVSMKPLKKTFVSISFLYRTEPETLIFMKIFRITFNITSTSFWILDVSFDLYFLFNLYIISMKVILVLMYKHSAIFFLNSIKTFYQEKEKLLMIKRTWFQVLYVKKETTIDTKGSKCNYPHQSFTFRCWWFLIEFKITSIFLNSIYELKYFHLTYTWTSIRLSTKVSIW